MQENREFLGTEPVGRLLLRLALPTVAAQLINMLYNIVDRIFIGHIPDHGALALTGVGVCMPIIMLISAFAALVSSGGAPRASIHMGKQEYDTAENILGNCFVLLISISAVLTAVLLIFGKELLLVFGASENTIGYASAYMRIYALGTVFVQLTLGLNAFITAQGFSRMAMLTVVIGAVLNILLDMLFILGFGMGVTGAAWATVISQGVSCLWCILFLTGKKTFLRIRKAHLRLKAGVILPCVALGFATFIMQASESILNVCFNTSLRDYGGDMAVGAMTVCNSIMLFVMLPLQGMGQGAQPITGYNYGARSPERVRRTFRLLLVLCVSYAAILWGAMLLAPRAFAGIFSSDAALLDYAERAIRVYCGALVLMGVQMACQLTFVSIGNAPCSIIVAVVRKFVLLIPLIYVLPSLVTEGTMGVFLAEPVADVLAVSFTVILFSVHFRKALKKIETKT